MEDYLIVNEGRYYKVETFEPQIIHSKHRKAREIRAKARNKKRAEKTKIKRKLTKKQKRRQ